MNVMHVVAHTSDFAADTKRAGLSEDEVRAIEVFLSENPTAGDVIPGTGGARKVRFGGRGKGKSGGYRTVHYYAGEDIPVFLLALINKGERADLTQAQRNVLRGELSALAHDYRAGVSARIVRMRRPL